MNIILIIITFQASTPTFIYISKLDTLHYRHTGHYKNSGYFHQELKLGSLELANVSFSDCHIRVILS
jgi:hypothetical protein